MLMYILLFFVPLVNKSCYGVGISKVNYDLKFHNTRHAHPLKILTNEKTFLNDLIVHRQMKIYILLSPDVSFYSKEIISDCAKFGTPFYLKTLHLNLKEGGVTSNIFTVLFFKLNNYKSFKKVKSLCEFSAINANLFCSMTLVVYLKNVSSSNLMSLLMNTLRRKCINITAFFARIERDKQFQIFKNINSESKGLCCPREPILEQKSSAVDIQTCQQYNKNCSFNNNCILRVGNLQTIIQRYYAENIKYKVLNIELLLLETIATKLGFQIVFRSIPWTNDINVLNAIHRKLRTRVHYDIICGSIPWLYSFEVTFTKPYESLTVVWMMPSQSFISLRGLITPFDVWVWFSIILLLLLGYLMIFFVQSNFSLYNIVSLLLGIVMTRQPVTLANRLIFISLALPGYVLTQLYLASLSGQLSYLSEYNISSITDILSAGFFLGSSFYSRNLFFQIVEDDLAKYSSDMLSNKEKNNLLLILNDEEYKLRLKQLQSGLNRSLVLLVITDKIDKSNSAFEVKNIINNYPLVFVVRCGFPFLSFIDRYIRNAVEGGLIEYWTKKSIQNSNSLESLTNILHLQELVPGFLMIIIGEAISFVIYIIELVKYHFSAHK